MLDNMKLLEFLLGVIAVALIAFCVLIGLKMYKDDQKANKQITAMYQMNKLLEEGNEINQRYTSWVISQ